MANMEDIVDGDNVNVDCDEDNVESEADNVDCVEDNVDCDEDNVEWEADNVECEADNVDCGEDNEDYDKDNEENYTESDEDNDTEEDEDIDTEEDKYTDTSDNKENDTEEDTYTDTYDHEDTDDEDTDDDWDDDHIQKLKERIEDAEMAQYYLSTVPRRLRRIGSLTCTNGTLHIIPALQDVIDPVFCDKPYGALSMEHVKINFKRENGDPPATNRRISRLRDIEATQEHIDLDPECAICGEEFFLGSIVHILPACQHVFHKECAIKWLSTRWSCPMCRHPLSFCRAGRERRVQIDALSSNDSVECVHRTVCSYDEPIQIVILARVQREITDNPHGNPIPPNSFKFKNPRIANVPILQVHRHSTSPNVEIVRVVLTVPAHARHHLIHVNVPASASMVTLKVSAPAYFQRVDVLASTTTEDISLTRDLVQYELAENEGEFSLLIVNFPAHPELTTNSVGCEAVSEKTVLHRVPTFISFERYLKGYECIL